MDNYEELENLATTEEELESTETEKAQEDAIENEELSHNRGQRMHSLDLYLDDLYSFDIVPQEQIDEWARLRSNATTPEEYVFYRNKIMEHNMRLVVSIAKRYEKDPEKLVDLIGAGHTGLCTAAEKYDPDKGFHFSTFAIWWIRQAITRERDETRGTIRLPVHAVEKLMKMIQFRDEIYKKTGAYPTIKEIAKEFQVTPETVTLFLTKSSLDSIDRFINDDKEATPLRDMIADSEVDVEKEVIKKIESEYLEQNLEKFLNHREYLVIKMRFGLDDENPMSLQQVGEKLGVTRERIRQIEARAIRKLRMNKKFRSMYRNIA